MTPKEFMQAWARTCQENPIIAVFSLPFIVLFSLLTAIWLFLKGDKRWREVI